MDESNDAALAAELRSDLLAAVTEQRLYHMGEDQIDCEEALQRVYQSILKLVEGEGVEADEILEVLDAAIRCYYRRA
jgi:hypothetical protein